jgi:phosphatidylglycerophosphate synthase
MMSDPAAPLANSARSLREPAAADVRPEPPHAPSLGSGEFNYFAEREQAAQARFRMARDQWLGPIVRTCLRAGISAEMVSGAALGMLVPFGIGLWTASPVAAAVLVIGGLLLHVALDGLDGPLARAAGTAGPAGAFTDMCLDHVGFLIVATLLAAAGRLDGAAACLYVSTYTVSVVCVIILNLLQRPLRYVLRTKYAFYFLVGGQQLGWLADLTPAVLAFGFVHAAYCVVGFVAVRRALSR